MTSFHSFVTQASFGIYSDLLVPENINSFSQTYIRTPVVGLDHGEILVTIINPPGLKVQVQDLLDGCSAREFSGIGWKRVKTLFSYP